MGGDDFDPLLLVGSAIGSSCRCLDGSRLGFRDNRIETCNSRPRGADCCQHQAVVHQSAPLLDSADLSPSSSSRPLLLLHDDFLVTCCLALCQTFVKYTTLHFSSRQLLSSDYDMIYETAAAIVLQLLEIESASSLVSVFMIFCVSE